jgi:hypothetical protein
MVTTHDLSFELPWPAVRGAVTAIFVIERMWTVRHSGRGAVVLAGLLVPEALDSWFLQLTYLVRRQAWR